MGSVGIDEATNRVDEAKVNAPDLHVVPLLIDGVATASSPETTFPVFSAKNRVDVYRAQSADVPTAERAAEATQKAFRTWRHCPAAARRAIILRAVDLLKIHKKELAAIQMAETSCTAAWADTQVDVAVDMVEEVAARITQVCGEVPHMATSSTLGMVFREPVGPSLLIAPWNASVVLSMRGLCVILGAGCTLLFKASELCPRTHNFLADIFDNAGLPKGVLNVIQTRREDAPGVTEALIRHQAIRKVEFIGSAQIGHLIGQLGGKYLKPVLMELGGKSAAIVLDDADLDEAADKCILGAFMHHGQICFSTERIIIVGDIRDEFVELLRSKAATFQPGCGVSDSIVKNAYNVLVDAEAKGAKFLVGGPRYLEPASLQPTLVTGVTRDMTIFDEESFGPSASVYFAKDDEEAIALTNDSKYGLNAAIHSTNMLRALNLGRRLEVSQVHVNSMTVHDEPTLPIGAIKGSGWGRNNGRWGLEEFSTERVMTFNMSNERAMTFASVK